MVRRYTSHLGMVPKPSVPSFLLGFRASAIARRCRAVAALKGAGAFKHFGGGASTKKRPPSVINRHIKPLIINPPAPT